jgi:hypothetical protein
MPPLRPAFRRWVRLSGSCAVFMRRVASALGGLYTRMCLPPRARANGMLSWCEGCLIAYRRTTDEHKSEIGGPVDLNPVFW